MKAIISHDIDHLTVWEHLLSDSILPKFLIRIQIELVSGKISAKEYLLRYGDFLQNKWQNLNELVKFNQKQGVPSSFFIAVEQGIGLSYTNAKAQVWIDVLKTQGCEIGIHGIAYDKLNFVQAEHDKFASMSASSKFGIRMHYVRATQQTYVMLSELGYTYDSTECAFKNPYKINNMWEFPIQIMDGWVIEKGKRWQTQSFEQAKENTLRLIDQAVAADLSHLCIDFHDRYYSSSFQTWYRWYEWLVQYLKQNNVQFVNFEQAIAGLEAK